MIDLNREKHPSCYEVQVGHSRVRVQGYSTHDAIRLARIKLGHELPRLYDVIHALADERFEVTKVDG